MSQKFKNFLKDKKEYEAAENYWVDLFEEYNSQLSSQSRWKHWFDSLYGNGEKIMDGNPIICRYSPELKKGIRIIQDGDEDYDQYAKPIGAWMDKFDDEIDELVVSCILSDKTESLVRKLINLYVVENLEPTTMQRIIDELFSAA